ncbi:MAG: thioredoxin domain-containing protein [Anaerolineae bacterium]|nr:thioredoxin domain-containing protein [Anaerolineae bacterium]
MTVNARQSARLQKKRRQTYFFVGVIVVVVIVFVALVALSNQPASDTSVADAGSGHYTDAAAGKTETGLYRLGSADAPVLMEVFSSFTCPHCAHFHETIAELADPYIKDGTLAVVEYLLPNSQRASLGTAAALCAGQQNPVKFWEMSDLVFSWISEPYDIQRVEAAAGELGLDTEALLTCMASDETLALASGNINEAMARGVGGTPAIFFNGARPMCSWGGDCEGNLPYETVVQNIEAAQGNAE